MLEIRNTFRYLLGNLNDKFEENELEKVDINKLPELEQFILHKIYKLNLDFELVGIRGNNPESTIIILEKNNYKLIEQGENITSQLSFSHVEGSRAYFFDGKDYSFLDIIGSEKSFNQDRIDLTKE